MNAITFKRFGFGVVVLLSGVAADASAPVHYTVIDLAPGRANAINSNGQVVGNSTPDAFTYLDDTVQSLGTLPGGTGSYANAINSTGQIVGQAYTYGNVGTHAFLYNAGVMNDLGTLNNANCSANGINNNGVIVGTAYLIGSSGYSYCESFLFSGSMHGIGNRFGGSLSAATGINNSGQVVGWASNGGASWAVLYNSGSAIDLGTLSAPYNFESVGSALNDLGQVVGSSHTAGDAISHAFLYESGSMHDLGILAGRTQSEASGINSNGVIVGKSWTVAGDYRAVLWDEYGIQDLNSLIPENADWILKDATGINDNGEICGFGQYGGQQRAFLLTPIPEPSTFALLGVGALGLLAYAWRRRERRGLGSPAESR